MSRSLLILGVLLCVAVVYANPLNKLLLKKGTTGLSSRGKDACGGSDYGTAGQFDYYVFELSWPAEFCSAHGSWPGCSNPTAWQQTNWTVHGLWPQYTQSQSGHGWPQCCQSQYGQDIDQSLVNEYLNNFQTYWPNEQDPTGKDLSNSLWEHEWSKHGTCSGLAQADYVTTVFNLLQSIPTAPSITKNIGGSTTTQEVLAFYGATGCTAGSPCNYALACDSGNTLSGMSTCWDKSFNQISCPSSVTSESQCSDGTIQIASFGSASM